MRTTRTESQPNVGGMTPRHGRTRTGTVDLMREGEVTCEACGEQVHIDFTKDDVTSMRELASTPAPGRVTIRVGDVVVHRCADGTFEPPENVIER